MSFCNSCLQGMCRRHPLQDHGKREKAFIEQLAKTQAGGLHKTYNDIIKSQIEKLEAESPMT